MDQFQECPTCAAKSGSPILCGACQDNRLRFENTKALLDELAKLFDTDFAAIYHTAIEANDPRTDFEEWGEKVADLMKQLGRDIRGEVIEKGVHIMSQRTECVCGADRDDCVDCMKDQINALLLSLDACVEFVRKVECGEARSRVSYAQMTTAITIAREAGIK